MVRAEVPASELLRYATDLRAMTSGTAAFTRHFARYEVLPEHVANAVFVLTAGELSHTTGLLVPVDAGVAAAFLR